MAEKGSQDINNSKMNNDDRRSHAPVNKLVTTGREKKTAFSQDKQKMGHSRNETTYLLLHQKMIHEALEQEIKDLEDENKRLRRENFALKHQFNLLKESKGSAPVDKQANDNKELQQLKVEIDHLKNRLSQKEKEITELTKDITRLKESKSSAPNSKQENDNKELQQLKVENDQLKKRLSQKENEIAELNKDITSDEFRPTKLSEEYSQLYDNQWIDAFEEHDGRKEEDIIQMLRTSLLGCYEFCEKLCTQFTDQLKTATLALPNAEPRTQDIPMVYKKQLQDVKKSFGAFLRNDVKESYWRKWNTVENGGKTKNYVDACVEICWLMVIQEPPVVLEAQASKDGVFDSEIFKTYTKTGKKVDFVVWPALRLHKGGPLLTKGVAQGKN